MGNLIRLAFDPLVPPTVPAPTPPIPPPPGPGPGPGPGPVPPADPAGPGGGFPRMNSPFSTNNTPTILSPFEQVREKNRRDMEERALSEKAASLGMAEDQYREIIGMIGKTGLARHMPEAMELFDNAMTTLQLDWGNREDLDAFKTIIMQAGGFAGATGFKRAIQLIGEFMDGVRQMGGVLDKRAIVSVILDVVTGRTSMKDAAEKVSIITNSATRDMSDPWGFFGGDAAKFQQQREVRQKFEQAMQTMFMKPQDSQQQSAALLERLMNSSSFAQDRLWTAVADAMGLPVANAMDMIRRTYGTLANAVSKDRVLRAALEPIIQTLTQMGLLWAPIGQSGYGLFGYNPLEDAAMPAPAMRAAESKKLIRIARTPENGQKLVRLSQTSGYGPFGPGSGTPAPPGGMNPYGVPPQGTPGGYGTPPQGGGFDPNEDFDITRRNMSRNMDYGRSQMMVQLKADVDAREQAITAEMATIKEKIDLYQQGLQGMDGGMPDTRTIALVGPLYQELGTKFDELVQLYQQAAGVAYQEVQMQEEKYRSGQIPTPYPYMQAQAAYNGFVQKMQNAVNSRQTMDVDSVVKPALMREQAIGVSYDLAKQMGDMRSRYFNVTDYGSAIGLASARSQQLFDAANRLEAEQSGQVSSIRAQQLRAKALQSLNEGLGLMDRSQQPNLSNADAPEVMGL